MEERISMSTKELERLRVLNEVKEKRLKQNQATLMLGVCSRQIRRLLQTLVSEGPKGLVSKRVGVPSNNRLSNDLEDKVLCFFNNKNHYDFGPTLTHEYLTESGVSGISVSSVRNIMIRKGIWRPKEIRKLRIHPLRPRRAKRGELIQLDGSEHDWFEGRGPRCTLLVFIDDATSETLHLKFVKSENTFDYLEATREYIEKHGRPEAYYPDKHGVFRVNHPGALSGDGRTQFGRAMAELDIKLICANTPQAKGRVERRNRDFQNRLIKAMRIAKISDLKAANAFLPSFLKKFNHKFSVAPNDPTNAHRPLLPSHNLDRIFCLKEDRQLSKNLTLQYDNVIYQVIAHRREYALRKAKVTVLQTKGGTILIEYRGKRLTAVPYHKMQARAAEVSSKELMEKLADQGTRSKYKPSKRHPWKRRQKNFSGRASELACCY